MTSKKEVKNKMSKQTVDPKLLKEIKKYGAFDISACYNCGTCTAICPLSDEEANFPRRIIRYAQLGQKEELLGSKELWLCYYCGECTDSCPREAEPGEFMMAARRYVIAEYEPTGFSKLTYKSGLFTTLIAIIISLFMGYAFRLVKGKHLGEAEFLFGVDPLYIHYAGYALFLFVVIAVVGGFVNMTLKIYKHEKKKREKKGIVIEETIFKKLIRWTVNAFYIVFVEFLAQKRYFKDDRTRKEKLLTSRYFVHETIVIGFTGLFLATALNFLMDLIKVMPTPVDGKVPLYYPIRLLGTISGILLIYGTTLAVIFRLMKKDSSREHSQFSDWFFLFLLWATGITGFVVELLDYLPYHDSFFWALVVHVVFAADLIIFAPFSKFAHMIYRTYAVWIYRNITTAPIKEPDFTDFIVYDSDDEGEEENIAVESAT